MKVEWGGVVLLNLKTFFLERAGPIAPPFWAPMSSINFQPPVCMDRGKWAGISFGRACGWGLLGWSSSFMFRICGRNSKALSARAKCFKAQVSIYTQWNPPWHDSVHLLRVIYHKLLRKQDCKSQIFAVAGSIPWVCGWWVFRWWSPSLVVAKIIYIFFGIKTHVIIA